MIAELQIVIYLKSHDAFEAVAGRVFGALGSPVQAGNDPAFGGECYTGSGLGLKAVLYQNSGDVLDPEFEDYQYALEISSTFWCVDLDATDLDSSLSEYYARLLAFDLNVETATEIFVEATEEAEIFAIRAFRRNPQYRLDQAPTIPRVFVIEERQVEEPFAEEDGFEEGVFEEEDED